jgi:hypothetical protein
MHGPYCRLGNFCSVGSRLKEVNVLGGAILPVWGIVQTVLSNQVFHQLVKHSLEKTYFADDF